MVKLSVVNNLSSLECEPVVHDLQTLETAFVASGQVVRENLEQGFLGDLVSAEHVYLRKCDEERLFNSLKRYYDWLKSLQISPRTARRMCALHLALRVTRTDILETVDLLYLRNVTATGLQAVIKLDADKKKGVDTGEFLRSEYKFEGIFLYFNGAEGSPHDLVDLSSRQINLLAFPEKAANSSSTTEIPEKSPSPSNADAHTSAAVEETDGKDERILQLEQRCKELEEVLLERDTERLAYRDTVPRAQFDELARKFAQYQKHATAEKKKLLADAGRHTDRTDFENETDQSFDEDDLVGASGDIADPAYTNSLDNVLAA